MPRAKQDHGVLNHSLNAGASVLAYSATSIAMTLMNKIIVTSYGFRYNWLLLCMQSLVSALLQMALRRAKVVDFRDLTADRAKMWLPVNLFFVAMLYSSFRALHRLTVPTVTVFKNLSVIGTTAGAWHLFGERISPAVLASMGLLVAGAVLSGMHDLSFDAAGYWWMAGNCITTAGYVLYMRYSVTMTLSQTEKAFYNNVMTLPLALVFAALSGELPEGWRSPLWADLGFVSAVVVSGAVGVLLNLASLWCIGATGATTYSMVGALNKIPLTIIGVFIFHHPMSVESKVFIGFGLLAGVIYGSVKAWERKEPQSSGMSTGSAAAIAAIDEDKDVPAQQLRAWSAEGVELERPRMRRGSEDSGEYDSPNSPEGSRGGRGSHHISSGGGDV